MSAEGSNNTSMNCKLTNMRSQLRHRGLPPARHVDLGDGKARKQVENGVEVGGADGCQLDSRGQRHTQHACINIAFSSASRQSNQLVIHP